MSLPAWGRMEDPPESNHYLAGEGSDEEAWYDHQRYSDGSERRRGGYRRRKVRSYHPPATLAPATRTMAALPAAAVAPPGPGCLVRLARGIAHCFAYYGTYFLVSLTGMNPDHGVWLALTLYVGVLWWDAREPTTAPTGTAIVRRT